MATFWEQWCIALQCCHHAEELPQERRLLSSLLPWHMLWQLDQSLGAEGLHTFLSSSTHGKSLELLPAWGFSCSLNFVSSGHSSEWVLVVQHSPRDTTAISAAKSSPEQQPRAATLPLISSSLKSSDSDWTLLWCDRGACKEGLGVCLVMCSTQVTPDKREAVCWRGNTQLSAPYNHDGFMGLCHSISSWQK